MSHRFAIDSLAVRGERLFGWGWFLDDTASANAIHLHVQLHDGTRLRLLCPQTGSRPDLAEAFPHIPHARGGGFMLQARIPTIDAIAEAALEAGLADGRRIRIELHGFPAAQSTAAAAGDSRNQQLLALLENGDWRALVRRAASWWSRLASAQPTFAASVAPRQASVQRWVVFDHAMGGGANHFRNEKLAEWRAAGHDVRLVTPVLNTLEYAIDGIGADGRSWQSRYPELQACLEALGGCAQVVVNELVSFDDPLRVLEWAVARKAEGARILFYLHDFHAVCPAWTLIGSDGRDCGVPGLAQCAQCLPANPALFLAMLPATNIPAWRQAWRRFLDAADEIVVFSPSSLAILQRAHPGLDSSRMILRPHSTSYLGEPQPPFVPDFGAVTTIAVVGHISAYKGAQVVREMAALIEREKLPARIVVVGSIDDVAPSAALSITGPYDVGELRERLVRERVGVALLPSIVRETFSYVTAELMHHQVPLAVFDLGAPAERVRDYRLGCIVSAIDARTTLREIITFHRALAANDAASSTPIAKIP